MVFLDECVNNNNRFHFQFIEVLFEIFKNCFEFDSQVFCTQRCFPRYFVFKPNHQINKMKSSNKTILAIMFATIMFTSMFIVNVDAGKKKKILAALLLGAALAAKPKILPIPLPVPVCFAIQFIHFSFIQIN